VAVPGFVTTPTPDVVQVSEGRFVTDASLSFGLADVKTFKYGDSRVFSGRATIPGTPRLRSALCFVYPDGTQVVLFEVQHENASL